MEKLWFHLFLYLNEVEFLRSVKKSSKRLAKTFSNDFISVNNPSFKHFLKDIDPEELVVRLSREMLCHA